MALYFDGQFKIRLVEHWLVSDWECQIQLRRGYANSWLNEKQVSQIVRTTFLLCNTLTLRNNGSKSDWNHLFTDYKFKSLHNILFISYSGIDRTIGPLTSIIAGSNCNDIVDKMYVKAGYTATQIACGWAGAVLEITRPFGQERWSQ